MSDERYQQRQQKVLFADARVAQHSEERRGIIALLAMV